MKNAIWTLPLICILIASIPVAAKSKGPDEIAWIEKIPQALGEADESRSPVIVDIWAVWCVPCLEMEETTYRDAGVLRQMEEFVPLKVDADLQQVFIGKYDISAYPTVLFLDHDGNEIARLLGMVQAGDLLDFMERVREGYAAYLAARDEKDDTASVETVASYFMDVGNARGAADVLKRSLKRLKNGEPAERERVEILFAEALLKAGADKQAFKSFERLAMEAQESDIRGRALAGLVQVNERRGQTEAAAEAREQLRAQYPDLAEKLQ